MSPGVRPARRGACSHRWGAPSLRLTGAARGSQRGRGHRTCAGDQCGFPPYRVGNEGQGAGAGAGGAPEGRLLPPRPPLEDVSGKAQVLPAGAEQDHLGGARALPEPVPGGLRRLWLRVVSVTGPGAVAASRPRMPQSQACPRGSAMHQVAGISLGGGHRRPLDPCPALPVRLAPSPCTPRWVVGCVQEAGPWGAGGRWWCWSSALAAPCAFPPWGLLLWGQARGRGRGARHFPGSPAGVQQKDPPEVRPPRAPAPAL